VGATAITATSERQTCTRNTRVSRVLRVYFARVFSCRHRGLLAVIVVHVHVCASVGNREGSKMEIDVMGGS